MVYSLITVDTHYSQILYFGHFLLFNFDFLKHLETYLASFSEDLETQDWSWGERLPS